MDASDQELQQYLFDLQGYLVIHDVLGAAEVAELNRLIDARRLPSPRESIRFGSAAGKHGPDHGFLNWGEPFCRLLDHEAILPILRLRLGDCFRLDRLYGIRMHKGQTMGSMHADYGASAPNSFTRPGRALSLRHEPHLRGVHGRGVESCRCRTVMRGILVYSRESQEPLQAAAPDPRGPGKGSLRGHSGSAGGVGRPVFRSDDARNGSVESRPRAADSALQVLRLPDGLVAGAGASAT